MGGRQAMSGQAMAGLVACCGSSAQMAEDFMPHLYWLEGWLQAWAASHLCQWNAGCKRGQPRTCASGMLAANVGSF